MHILGFCNGQPGGNSEILLKIALTHALHLAPSITTSWIHAPSIMIPPNPIPLDGALDPSAGTNKGQMSGGNSGVSMQMIDDRRAALEAILDADAIMVSSPTYSHQPPALLKALMDRIGGPFLDIGFVSRALERQKAGDPKFAKFSYDPRLLKPRVLGFMMTGGSTTPDQFSMALQSLHLLFYCLHAKVVDQFVGRNCMDAGSVLLKLDIVNQAKTLAERLVSQLGKTYDQAKYLGFEEAGSCPYCHLRSFELFNDGQNSIGCTTCGARGRLIVDKEGAIRPEIEEDSEWCIWTMRGKRKHADDILQWGERERGKMAGIQAEKEKWLSTKVTRSPLPSLHALDQSFERLKL